MSQRWRKRAELSPGPLVLGLECGGAHLCMALIHQASEDATWTLIHETTVARGHRHADAVLGLVHRELDRAGLSASRLSLVGVASGPGGFTGIRVGLATADGLGMGLGIPVWPVGSLEVLALNASPSEGVVVPMIDARRGEVYTGAFQVPAAGTPRPLSDPILASGAEALAEIANLGIETPSHIFGSGAQVMGVATEVPSTWHVPRGTAVASLALDAWLAAGSPDTGPPLDARYIRKSDAEIDAERRSSPSASATGASNDR